MKSILNGIAVAFLGCISLQLSAQGNGLTVKGIVTHQGTPLKGAGIKVFNGNNRLLEQKESDPEGSFQLRLPLDGYYVLEFQYPGMIKKRLLFRTKTPDDEKNYHPFDVEIALYDSEKVEKTSEFDPDMPLGIVEYFPKKGDFDYVEEYTLERLKEQQKLHGKK